MDQSLAHPHDVFVRRAFSHLDLARDFMTAYLPPKLARALDLEQLQPAKGSFVSKDLKTRFSDIHFKVPFAEAHARLSLLVEHKSEGALKKSAHVLPFQIRQQEMKIMEEERRNDPEKVTAPQTASTARERLPRYLSQM